MKCFEPERLFVKDGKTYLLQNPFYNNCVVVALFNAFLDDDQGIDLGDLYKLEQRLNTKYDIQNQGLLPAMIGDIAWKFGYKTGMDLAPLTENSKKMTYKLFLEKHKILRVYGWSTKYNTLGHKLDSLNRSSSYKKMFSEKYPRYFKKIQKKIKNKTGLSDNGRNVISCNDIGSHIFFCQKMEEDQVFGVNWLMGVGEEVGWSEIGLNTDKAKEGFAVGTELSIILTKKSPS